MNFQAVLQAKGNNVTMFGTFNEIGGIALTQNQKQVSKCKITDDNSEKHTVNIYGTMPLPTMLNMRAQFSLSSYEGTTQQGQAYTGYSGFWNDRVNVQQQGQPTQQQAPQSSPQRPQQPAQGKNKPDWDAIAAGKVRHGILCAMLSGGIAVDYAEVLLHTEFVISGKIDSNAPALAQPNVARESDEFCTICGNPHLECTCKPPW